jgi:predicted permease
VRDPTLQGGLLWDPLQPGRSSVPSVRTRITVWIVGGATLLLTLVLANLLNLFIARTAAGRREVAVRLAIGGGRRHLLRLLLLEAGLLGAGAAATALILAGPATAIMRGLLFPDLTWSHPSIDGRIGLFAFGLALLMGGVVAFLNAHIASRVDPAKLLRSAGSDRATIGRRAAIGRRSLVTAQASIFVLILAGAMAFVTSVRRALDVDLGFDVDRVFVASLPLQSVGYRAASARRFYVDARERLARLPGLESVSLGYTEPWQNNRSESLRIPGFEGTMPFVLFDAVTPEYARTMGLRIRQGRWLAEYDSRGNPPVVVVNEAFVRVLLSAGPAIGTCIGIGADSLPCRTVVGVVSDARMTGSLDAPPAPIYYVPLAQADAYGFTPRLFVRSSGPMRDAMDRVRRELQASATDIPAVSVRPLTEDLAPVVSTYRLGRAIFGAFGALAGVIATVGLFSVLTLLATERRRDYAIRVALGAPRVRVVAPILRHSAESAAAGVVLGLAAVLLLAPRTESLFFRTSIAEPAVLLPVVLLGVVVSLVAAIAPIRSILRADAMSILREP